MIRQSKQADARDKVYGILSIFNTSLSSRVVPDYNRSVLDIYTDFAKAMIEDTSSLDMVSAFSDDPPSHRQPSWAPDWSVAMRRSFIPPKSDSEILSKYHSQATFRFGEDGRSSVTRYKIDVANGHMLEERKCHTWFPACNCTTHSRNVWGQQQLAEVYPKISQYPTCDSPCHGSQRRH
jgi:hypothetical protein